MAYDLMITDDAHNDIDEVLAYITGTLSNRFAAASLMDQIDACYAQLQKFPFSFEPCRDIRLKNLGYRKAVIENFVMVYRPLEEEHRVYILRFFYGGRDYEKLL